MGPNVMRWIDAVREMETHELLELAQTFFCGEGASEFMPNPNLAPQIVSCLALSGMGFADLYPKSAREHTAKALPASRHFFRHLKRSLMDFDYDGTGSCSRLRSNNIDIADHFETIGYPGIYWTVLTDTLLGIARLPIPHLSVLAHPLGLIASPAELHLETRFLDHIANAFLVEHGQTRAFTFRSRTSAPTLRQGPL